MVHGFPSTAFHRLRHVLRSQADKDKEARVAILHSLLGFLDSRSFSTVWYWLLLLGLWSMTGRSVLGVPTEVVFRARATLRGGDVDSPLILNLLDWLSLVLPRWRLGRTEGTVFLGLAAFGLSSLGLLGFLYGLEMAQALTLMFAPFLLLFWMRILLARRLRPLMAQAEAEALPLAEVAAQAVGRMIWHRFLVTLLSVVSVAFTALWGAYWIVTHPFGI